MYTCHNFSFCVSEYIASKYNLLIDEHICFILGSSLNLQLSLKNRNQYNDIKPDLLKLDSYFLESNNPLAIENFSSNINAVFRIDQNNDLNDIIWIASDYLNLNNMKTIVQISSDILSEDRGKYFNPLYATVYFPNLTNEDLVLEKLQEELISVSLTNKTEILINCKDFFRYWNVKDNELYNSNRYVVIPPLYRDFENSLPKIVKNSLIRQYYYLTEKDGWTGPRLIKRLRDNVKYDSSEANINRHVSLLKTSIECKNTLSYNDMDRFYASQSFRILFDKNIINEREIVDVLESCGRCWIACYDKLNTQSIDINLILDIYNDLYEKESMIIDSLYKIMSSWK